MAGRNAAPKDPEAELAKIYAAVNKSIGGKADSGIMHRGSDSVPVNRLPFRQQNLNYATEGGAPWGRWTTMYGEESTGKTRVAYELIAQAQALPYSAEVELEPRISYHQSMAENTDLGDSVRAEHKKVAERLQNELDWIRENFPNGAHASYYNVEGQWDPIYAAKLGIDTSQVSIVETNTIEHIGTVLRGTFSAIPMHVVDSTSSASSLLSQKQEAGKSLVGTDARQWKAVMRDLQEDFDINRNMGILIQQMSTNVRSGGGQAQTTRFLRHTASLTLRFNRGRFLYADANGVLGTDKPTGFDDDSMSGLGEANGCEVFVKVEKSRTCRPFRNAGLQWDYRKGGFVPLHEFVSTGLFYGIIEKNGSWFKIDGENIGQGLKSVYHTLADDEELRGRISARQMDYVTDEALVKG